MAQIVLGLGTSHTPQISAPTSLWQDYAEADMRNPQLVDRDGVGRPYLEVLKRCDGRFADAVNRSAWERIKERADASIERLQVKLADAAPDVVLIFGNDQSEQFLDDAIPVFTIMSGQHAINLPLDTQVAERIPEGVRAGTWAAHGDEIEYYDIDTSLANHLIRYSTSHGFDVCQVAAQNPERSIGHAFSFVPRRLSGERSIPIVPIAVNTFNEANQPSSRRCFEFGSTIAEAVVSFDKDLAVAVVASGGLTHTVIDEEFDRCVVAALKANDEEFLTSIPPWRLHVGSSEILNWVAAAGALQRLTVEEVEYLPAYRTAAGTGVGLCFAIWKPTWDSNRVTALDRIDMERRGE